MKETVTRRQMLLGSAGLLAGMAAADRFAAAADAPATLPPSPGGWPISLNTSTLRGHKLPITDVIDMVAKAGYAGIEPWQDELDKHVAAGGSLKDLDKRLKDHGLKVTGGITFFEWMVDDDKKRAAGFEDAKRRIDQFAQISAMHIAAPPSGAVKGVSLLQAAERYADLLKLAEGTGVVPAVEVWGFAENISRLGQAVCVAMEAHRPEACVLPDVFHLFKGGSGLSTIPLMNPRLLGGFHLNDYAAGLAREAARDSDRVYPGDGSAPLVQLFRDLRTIGYRGPVSIELFNPEYYKQDPLTVARTALDKTRQLMETALHA